MTKEAPKEEITTLISLMSIIETSRNTFLEPLKSFERKEAEYQRWIDEAKAEKDFQELDKWRRIVGQHLNTKIAWFVLGELKEILQGPTLSGKKGRFFAIVTEVMPRVCLDGHRANVMRGKRAWWWIFDMFGLDRGMKVVFPVIAEEVDVLKVEEELLRIVGENEELSVADVGAVLCWEPRSKTYREVKKALEERGWVWKSVKREGVVRKVICVPER